MKNNLLENLNKEQLEAVTHTGSPLLIVAGAGTGKTKVITTRIAYLINQKLARPEEILALTFTEKAASEMEERVDLLVPYGYISTQISTFHAFGELILSEFAFNLGINNDFNLLSTEKQVILFNEHIFDFNLKYFRPGSNPLKYVRPILIFFSRCKDELITPEDIIKDANTKLQKAKEQEEIIDAEKYLELGNAFKNYQDLLKKYDYMDFGDQINLVVRLLKEHPDIRAKLQKRYKYILIDEFQDTNIAQNEIIKLLVGKDNNVTVVGDDDQSIYKFRGASISNIMDFTETFKNTKIIVLNQNYRSTQQILDAAYQLIQCNNPDRLEVKHHINKKLLAQKQGKLPSLKIFTDHYAEAKNISDDIINKIKSKKYKYSDIAIITRSNANYSHIVSAFKTADIPYLTSSAISLFENEPVQICINLIKFLTNPYDNLALFQLLTSPIYNVNIWDMAKISGYAKLHNSSIVHIVEDTNLLQEQLELSKDVADKLSESLDEIKKYETLAKNKTTRELLYKFLSDKKYIGIIIKKSQYQQSLVNFFKKIEEFESISTDKTIFNYIKYLLEDLQSGATFNEFVDSEIDAVTILTAHSSKGLEFEVVYLPTLTSDYFPSKNRKSPIEIPDSLIKETLPEKDFHLEEERRLFYVAATRAKQELHLSYAINYGGTRAKKPSVFIQELLNINIKDQKIIEGTVDQVLEQKTTQTDLFAYANNKKKKLTLNAHKIDDYLTCPLKYYYSSEIKLPISKDQSVVYGNAIHKAIEFYLRSAIDNKLINLEDIIQVFENNWSSEGFVSQSQEAQRKQEGIDALTNFYNNNQELAADIFEIEKPFSFQFSPQTKINGRYDIILKNEDKIKIGDFKTSNIGTQKQADSRLKNSRQMLLYTLAYFTQYQKLPDELSLIFIGNDYKTSLKPNNKTLEKITKDIQTAEKGIIANDFTAKPSKFTCNFCAYKSICPKKQIGV